MSLHMTAEDVDIKVITYASWSCWHKSNIVWIPKFQKQGVPPSQIKQSTLGNLHS